MKHFPIIAAASILFASNLRASETFWLSSLDLQNFSQDWGSAQKDRSVDRHDLSIGGRKFEHGVGTHAISIVRIALGETAEKFSASVGVDDEVSRQGSIAFKIQGDGKTLWESGVMHGGDAPKVASVNLHGVDTLVLSVDDAGDGISYDHADWADAQIIMMNGKPMTVGAPPEPAIVLTPKTPPQPAISGARVFGIRPNAPFLFTIPATGDRPMRFSAAGLPNGLRLDGDSGQITGMLTKKGSTIVELTASNSLGAVTSKLKIVCGDTIALTPPMGWNSWNGFGCDVTEANVRAAADAMVSSGLINHGWTYINIDDCWEAGRDADGNILSNEKFPDMKALTAYVHSKGLKIGLYSSPGPKTCAGHTASYQHEEQDARRYAEWGFDYLKYDWCSYGNIARNPNHEQLMKPYQVMRTALDKVPRDIVFSLCQYGMGDVWTWGADVGGNCWRTTGDINDSWSSMSRIGFGQNGHEKFAGPGHWNDPDMLVVGYVGWSANVRPTKLTPNEQYTHISLWCLLDAPLLIGCDMSKLDPFTLNLLANDEVLAVSQDALGKQAARVVQDGPREVWAKDMEDGSKAVGLFNRDEDIAQVAVKWSDLGLTGKQSVRDLWRQKNIGSFDKGFTATVPRHGVVFVKVAALK